jgi:hypothetical protein
MLDGDHVAEHCDAIQLTMDIGEGLDYLEQDIAEPLAPI